MKTASLASVLALVLAMSAVYPNASSSAAEADKPELNTQTEKTTGGNYDANRTYDNSADRNDGAAVKSVKEGLREADNSLRQTADEIRAFFVGDEGGGALEPVMIRSDRTAKSMLDEPVLNTQGKEISKLTDIIIDQNGRAALAVVTDGGFLGIGNKVAAFDYSKVVTQRDDGKIVMSLTQSMIDEAKDFSYDRDDRADSKVIPASSVSVKDLLDGELLDNRGKDVGSIDNLSIDGARADRVIVGFNKKLGMGGDFAALNYAALEKLRSTGEVDLQMNAKQSTQFARFGQSSMK